MAGLAVLNKSSSEIVGKFGKTQSDTGSPEVQIALITKRINYLNSHFKKNPMDSHSKTGLFKLVGQRRRLLAYLRKKSHARYSQVLKELNLRK